MPLEGLPELKGLRRYNDGKLGLLQCVIDLIFHGDDDEPLIDTKTLGELVSAVGNHKHDIMTRMDFCKLDTFMQMWGNASDKSWMIQFAYYLFPEEQGTHRSLVPKRLSMARTPPPPTLFHCLVRKGYCRRE